MIIRCTTIEQIKQIVDFEGWDDWTESIWIGVLKDLVVYSDLGILIQGKGRYASCSYWINEKEREDEIVDFYDVVFSTESKRIELLPKVQK